MTIKGWLFGLSLVCMGCSASLISPEFEGFSKKDPDKQTAILKSLMDFGSRPFEKSKIQEDLISIAKSKKYPLGVRTQAINVLTLVEGRDLTHLFFNLIQDPDCPPDFKVNLSLKLGDQVAKNKKVLDFFIAKLNDPRQPDGMRMNIALKLGNKELKVTPELIAALKKAHETTENYSSIRTNAKTSLNDLLGVGH